MTATIASAVAQKVTGSGVEAEMICWRVEQAMITSTVA